MDYTLTTQAANILAGFDLIVALVIAGLAIFALAVVKRACS